MKRFNCNVICEDDQGEYVRYEDVRDHQTADVLQDIINYFEISN